MMGGEKGKWLTQPKTNWRAGCRGFNFFVNTRLPGFSMILLQGSC